MVYVKKVNPLSVRKKMPMRYVQHNITKLLPPPKGGIEITKWGEPIALLLPISTKDVEKMQEQWKVEHLQESGKEVPKAMNVPVKDFNWFKGWFDESDDMIRTEDYEKEKKNIK